MSELGLMPNPKNTVGVSLNVDMGEGGVWVAGLTKEQQQIVIDWLCERLEKDGKFIAMRMQ